MKVPWQNGEWRRVAVYGLGVSGRAAAALLLARGVEVVAFDRRSASELSLGELGQDPRLRLRSGDEPEVLPDGIDGVVLSPGVPLDRPLIESARRHGVPVVAEVELAFALLDGEVAAITGSNGKSTTTALTGAMLGAAGHRVVVCGNIGEPLAAQVDGEPGRIFVVELSSFQLEGVDHFRPRAAALLNVSPDHLDRHGDLEGYRRAKARIFRRQGPGDVAVLNARDPLVRTLVVASKRRFFDSRGEVRDGCHRVGEEVLEVRPGAEPRLLFRADEVPLRGPHNLENAMAAALLARAFGAEPEAIRAALASFQGLPHRLERVAERDGVVYYDDSKGTNPAAVVPSLEGFDDGSVHLILGGRFKGGDLGDLRRAVERKARRAYLIGEAAERFAAELPQPFEIAGTLERAVASAARRARPGEVVLLSPACASFDQFANFAERGREFRRLVERLDERLDSAGALAGQGEGDGA